MSEIFISQKTLNRRKQQDFICLQNFQVGFSPLVKVDGNGRETALVESSIYSTFTNKFLFSSVMKSSLPKKTVALLGLDLEIPLLVDLREDGKLKIWNLLSDKMVKEAAIKCHYTERKDYIKLISWNDFEGCILIYKMNHFEIFYIKVSQDYNVEEFRSVGKIVSNQSNLIEFTVEPLEQKFTLVSLWDQPADALYTLDFEITTDLELSHRPWVPVKTKEPIQPQVPPTENVQEYYISQIFDTVFPLEMIAEVAEYPYEDVVYDKVYDYLIDLVSSSVSDLEVDFKSQVEACNAEFYRFYICLVKRYNQSLKLLGLLEGERGILREGGEGVVRGLDIVDYNRYTQGYGIFEDDAVNQGFLALLALSNVLDSKTEVFQVLMDEICKVGAEMVLDDYTALVFDRVADSLDLSEKSQLLYYATRISNLNTVVKNMLQILQHPDLPGTDDGEYLEGENLKLIETGLVEILEKRSCLVRNIFYTFCVLAHLSPELCPPLELMSLLQSLVCCYKRLSWISKQYLPSKISLWNYILSSQIKFSPEGDTLKIIKSTLERLGWARAYPLASAKESARIIVWANIFINVCNPNETLNLMNMVSISPASMFLTARCFLEMKEFTKAKMYFEKAGCISDSSDLHTILPILTTSPTLSFYHQLVMQTCQDSGVYFLTIHFGKLALMANPTENQRSLINDSIFKSSYSCHDFYNCYESVMRIVDPVFQQHCLRNLIISLVDNNRLDLLCGGLAFVGVHQEVENTLHFKARTDPGKVESDSMFYKISYAYFIYRADFRNGNDGFYVAAITMFQQGLKLANMPWNDTYTTEQVKSVTSRMSLCFLSSLNCLSLLDTDDAYIKSPKTVTIYRNGKQSTDKIIKLEDVKKMYHLTMAKLELLQNVPHFGKTFQIPDPLDLFGVYCERYDTQNALALASILKYDLEKVVISSADVIVSLCKNQKCIVPDQEEFANISASPLTRAWLTLKKILEHDDAHLQWKYHELAIKHLLKSVKDYCLPNWLTSPLRDHSAVLIRIYLAYDRPKDAFLTAMKSIENSRRPMEAFSHHSRTIPLTVLDQLLFVLKRVDSVSHKKLFTAVAEYTAFLSTAPLR